LKSLYYDARSEKHQSNVKFYFINKGNILGWLNYYPSQQRGLNCVFTEITNSIIFLPEGIGDFYSKWY